VVGLHWTQKDYPIHCYDERNEIIATPINSNRFTEFYLKSKNVNLKKFKAPIKRKFPLFSFLGFKNLDF